MIYHIFTNNHDEYCDHLDTAIKLFKEFVAEEGCARLYEKINEEDEGDCIMSHGNYPT